MKLTLLSSNSHRSLCMPLLDFCSLSSLLLKALQKISTCIMYLINLFSLFMFMSLVVDDKLLKLDIFSVFVFVA